MHLDALHAWRPLRRGVVAPRPSRVLLVRTGHPAPEGQRVIVGAYVDDAAPEHPAGAEWTIQDVFAWLAKRGHQCRVMSRNGYTGGILNGVTIQAQATDEELAGHFQACDVMLTQLGATMHAQMLAATYQTPLVQYVHSENQIDQLGVVASCSALVVFNARHVADACSWWPGQSIVMRPPIDADRVRVPPGGACTTLVNVSTPKGGGVLWRLAQNVEGFPFLGVQGAYDHQALRPDGLATFNENEAATGLPVNLQVMGSVRDIRNVLAFTRTLLVLSHSETYGRIAAEAAVSGIPTICVDTPGLRECLGTAAAYVDRADARNLEHLVRRSYQPEVWSEWSAAATRQWEMLAVRQEKELRAFERALRRINKEKPRMTL